MLGEQHPAVGSGHALAEINDLEPREGRRVAHRRFPIVGIASIHGRSLLNRIVPLAADIPPTPCATEILAPLTCAAAPPRSWRTLSCSEAHFGQNGRGGKYVCLQSPQRCGRNSPARVPSQKCLV